MDQEFTSKDTSLPQVAGILKLVDRAYPDLLKKGVRVLDYGGGKYDYMTEKLAERGISGLVYDPFNRTEEHNKAVWDAFSHPRPTADVAFCANVLNVIKEPKVRVRAYRNLKVLCQTGPIFFTVHEGKKDSRGRKTTRGWQANRPTKNYVPELRKEFGTVQRKGKLLICYRNKEAS